MRYGMTGYERGDMYKQIVNREHEFFKTHKYMTVEQLIEIIAWVMADNNVFEMMDECEWFDASQIL